MYNSKILLNSLTEYKSSLERHCNSLEVEFKTLEKCWDSFKRSAEGDYIRQFSANWRKTQNQFNEYINRSKNILKLLDDRIENLTIFSGEQGNFLNSSIQIASSIATLGIGYNDPNLAAIGITALSTILTSIGGGHKSKYQKARQQFLLGLIDNPTTPKYVKGWIKQEQNRIWNFQKSRVLRRTPRYMKGRVYRKRNEVENPQRLNPSGLPTKKKEGKKSRAKIRGIPGFDVGHRYPKVDLSSTFRLEDISMNRSRPGRAKSKNLSSNYN
jgi:hypothetical protein